MINIVNITIITILRLLLLFIGLKSWVKVVAQNNEGELESYTTYTS